MARPHEVAISLHHELSEQQGGPVDAGDWHRAIRERCLATGYAGDMSLDFEIGEAIRKAIEKGKRRGTPSPDQPELFTEGMMEGIWAIGEGLTVEIAYVGGDEYDQPMAIKRDNFQRVAIDHGREEARYAKYRPLLTNGRQLRDVI